MTDKLRIMKDKYGDNYWYLPLGTWVRAIIYEDFEVIGQVSNLTWNEQDGCFVCEVKETGVPHGTSPWSHHTIYPLSKLERAML